MPGQYKTVHALIMKRDIGRACDYDGVFEELWNSFNECSSVDDICEWIKQYCNKASPDYLLPWNNWKDFWDAERKNGHHVMMAMNNLSEKQKQEYLPVLHLNTVS